MLLVALERADAFIASMRDAQASAAQRRCMPAFIDSHDIGEPPYACPSAGLRWASSKDGARTRVWPSGRENVFFARVQTCARAQPASAANSSEANIVVMGETLEDESIMATASAARWTRTTGSP